MNMEFYSIVKMHKKSLINKHIFKQTLLSHPLISDAFKIHQKSIFSQNKDLGYLEKIIITLLKGDAGVS